MPPQDANPTPSFGGFGVRRTEAWEYDAAVTGQTAGIAYAADRNARPALSEVVELAHRNGLPVLVDAAGELPPISNLRAFMETGADLVAFRGGKVLRGPQSTGILCGRRELIASVALQHLDMDEHFELWEPSEDLITKSDLVGLPRHGIGRGFKVAKEGIAGVLTALKLFAEGKIGANLDEQRGFLEYVADGLSGLPAEPRIITDSSSGQPIMHLLLRSQILGKSGFEVCRELRAGEPGVFPGEALLSEDTLVISPFNLDRKRTEALTGRLRAVLSKA